MSSWFVRLLNVSSLEQIRGNRSARLNGIDCFVCYKAFHDLDFPRNSLRPYSYSEFRGSSFLEENNSFHVFRGFRDFRGIDLALKEATVRLAVIVKNLMKFRNMICYFLLTLLCTVVWHCCLALLKDMLLLTGLPLLHVLYSP